MSNISGVILAGGANTRFGGKMKPKMNVCGQTIIARMTVTLKEIFSELILVTNSPEEFSSYTEYKIVPDLFIRKGPLGGIHAAMKASSFPSIFVFAGDMPLLDKNLITRQIDEYKKVMPDILVPSSGEYIEPLHSIYSNSLLHSIEDYLSGNNKFAVRDFFNTVNVAFMPTREEEKNAFLNINTPSDILYVEEIIAQGK